MQPIIRSEKLSQVHSDIRGPVYVEAMKMIAEGTPVLRLNTGNPATFGFTMPPSVRHALLENADKAVGYCDFRGMPAARQAILEYETGKGIQGLTPDDIFVGNGVSEMAQFAITTLLNYGDEILLPSPSYSLWTNVTLIAGAKPVFYTCDEASDWYPDVEDIRRKITSRTRAILIINPNNPTGALYPRELLEQIVAKMGIPPFLLGLSWSSTERMSSQQADMLTSELTAYRRILEPAGLKICKTWLRLNGFDDTVEIDWDEITMQDEVDHANAAYLMAKTNQLLKEGEA